jgi:hypothetical protein
MAVSGGEEIDAIAGGDINSSTIAALQTKINNSTSLFATAGIDIDTPPTVGLSTLMGAATSLHKIGADGSGAAAMAPLANMMTNDVFGDSIKVALAEGKNNKLMAANGIMPPVYNPFPGPNFLADHTRRWYPSYPFRGSMPSSVSLFAVCHRSRGNDPPP